ncbi:hypothetical protein M0P65_05195 [Candidatus Gracilibacteria bacterium]|nr:hypothetical protein [Candidatus Gracilibacteria bacterium]
MIGYKATENGKCLGQLYEVGKTYTFYGEMEMCKKGFHFCEDLIDVFEYYPPNKNTKIFKVESIGDIYTEGNKSLTNKLKILEEISLKNLKVKKHGMKFKFNEKSNLVKQEYPLRISIKYKYDDRNNRIKLIQGDFWCKYKYNKNNNLIEKIDSNGVWEEIKYDKNNNLIEIKYDDSLFKYEYDENNNKIKYESSNGYWVKWEYNENNKLILEENSNGYWYRFEYDENNNTIKTENYSGFKKIEKQNKVTVETSK